MINKIIILAVKRKIEFIEFTYTQAGSPEQAHPKVSAWNKVFLMEFLFFINMDTYYFNVWMEKIILNCCLTSVWRGKPINFLVFKFSNNYCAIRRLEI